MAHARSYVGTRNCATCGTTFRLRADAAKLKDRGKYCSTACSNQGRSLPLVADVADLKRLYVDEKKTTREIATIYGSTWKHVSRTLKRMGVKLRQGREARGHKRSRMYRTIAQAQEGRLLKSNEVVHHIDCNWKNNKPENLAVVLGAQAQPRTSQAIGEYLGCSYSWLWTGSRSIIRRGLSDGGQAQGTGDLDGNESVCASAVGAPHRRDRVWIIAYPARSGRETRDGDGLRAEPGQPIRSAACEAGKDVADAAGQRLEGSKLFGSRYDLGTFVSDNGWWLVEPDVRGMADGISPRSYEGGLNETCMGTEEGSTKGHLAKGQDLRAMRRDEPSTETPQRLFNADDSRNSVPGLSPVKKRIRGTVTGQ